MSHDLARYSTCLCCIGAETEFLDVIGTRPPPPCKSGLKLVCNVNIVYGNLKSENSQAYAQKPQWNCMFINSTSEAEFLDEIQKKSEEFSSLLLTLTSTALLWDFYFFKLTQPLTYFFSSVTVHCKGERKKTWWKTVPPSPWFKKSIQKHQVWKLSRLCPETSTKLYVHEFGFWTKHRLCEIISIP